MRCKSTLQREHDRLERALRDLRNEMAGIMHGSTPLKMMLDEAHLMGELKAINYAMSTDEGGWPHDTLFVFTDARRDAVLSMAKAGKEVKEILDTLHIHEMEVRLMIKLDADKDQGKN